MRTLSTFIVIALSISFFRCFAEEVDRIEGATDSYEVLEVLHYSDADGYVFIGYRISLDESNDSTVLAIDPILLTIEDNIQEGDMIDVLVMRTDLGERKILSLMAKGRSEPPPADVEDSPSEENPEGQLKGPID